MLRDGVIEVLLAVVVVDDAARGIPAGSWCVCVDRAAVKAGSSSRAAVHFMVVMRLLLLKSIRRRRLRDGVIEVLLAVVVVDDAARGLPAGSWFVCVDRAAVRAAMA